MGKKNYSSIDPRRTVMKRSFYTATLSLAFLAAVPAIRAYANSIETSGGAVRTHLEAQSKLKNPSFPKAQVPTKAPGDEALNKRNTKLEKTDQADKPDSKLDDSYPAYCETLPSWVKPGDFEYNEALYKCKYG
ncbi:hypothetical protein AB3R30_12185 [Leptolyngbyaceae cyanobacterium UHCC 1019]